MADIIWIYLITYALSYLFAGIVHQAIFYDKCPGQKLMTNATDGTHYLQTIACPEGQPATSHFVWALVMFFQVLSTFQMPLLIMMLSGHGLFQPFTSQREKHWKIVVLGFQTIACILAVVAAASHSLGWLIAGLSTLILTPITFVASIIGLIKFWGCGGAQATDGHDMPPMDGAQKLFVLAFLFSFIGLLIQYFGGSACGPTAYRTGLIAAGSCPFPFDGLTGFNHNAVYHIFEIISKILVIVASRQTVLDFTPSPPSTVEETEFVRAEWNLPWVA